MGPLFQPRNFGNQLQIYAAFIPADGRLQLHCDASLKCCRFIAVYGQQHTKPVRILRGQKVGSVISSTALQMALQPGVGLGLRYNMPPGLSVPCSISPFVYPHLSQVHGHVIQPSHSWSSSSSCCIQLPVQHLFLRLRCLAFFLYAQAILFFGI